MNAFTRVDELAERTIESLAEERKIILRQSDRLIKQLVRASVVKTFRVGEKKYRVALCDTRLFRSEVGNAMLAEGIDFSVCWSWQLDKKEFWLSFRSSDDRVDVSEVAKFFNGNGHRNASGATISNLFDLLD